MAKDEAYSCPTARAVAEAWMAVARFHNEAALEQLEQAVAEGLLTPHELEALREQVDESTLAPDLGLAKTVKALYGPEGAEAMMARAEALQVEAHERDRERLKKQGPGFWASLRQGFRSIRL